jgi:hypothetical protein
MDDAVARECDLFASLRHLSLSFGKSESFFWRRCVIGSPLLNSSAQASCGSSCRALWREMFMRTLRLALVVSRVTLEQSKIFAVTRVVAIVVATTTMVLGASFVAVALSLA